MTRVYIRAQNPARVAKALRALGMDITAPDRANPDKWFIDATGMQIVMEDALTVVNGSASPSGPGAWLVPRGHGNRLSAVTAVLGGDAVTRSGSVTEIEFDPGFGLKFIDKMPEYVIREGRAEIEWRNIQDDLGQHLPKLWDAIDAAEASNPLLGGVNLNGQHDYRWWLLLDAPSAADLSAVQAVLDEAQSRHRPVAVRSHEVQPHVRRKYERLGFDLPKRS